MMETEAFSVYKETMKSKSSRWLMIIYIYVDEKELPYLGHIHQTWR